MAIIKDTLDRKARERGFENWIEMSKHLKYSYRIFVEECLACALEDQPAQRSLI